jgi:hypothetical protein
MISWILTSKLLSRNAASGLVSLLLPRVRQSVSNTCCRAILLGQSFISGRNYITEDTHCDSIAGRTRNPTRCIHSAASRSCDIFAVRLIMEAFMVLHSTYY